MVVILPTLPIGHIGLSHSLVKQRGKKNKVSLSVFYITELATVHQQIKDVKMRSDVLWQ